MSRLRTAYFVVANTALLLVVGEGSAHVAIKTYDRVVPALSYQKLSEPAKGSYAHMTPAEVDELLRATVSLRFRYTHEAGFVEDVITSRFVNIDAHGVRSNGSGPRDITTTPDAIWFFGGSTAFGYGIADRETIPAQLEGLLGRPVMNLAVRGDTSANENRLLNYYLRIGYRPARAVFLDGINETCGTGMFEAELDDVVARAQDGYTWDFGKPVIYAYTRISRKLKRMMGLEVDPPDLLELNCEDAGRRTPLRTILTRTMAERDALCRLYDVPCQTFVQPFAGVHGRHDDRAFLDSTDATYMRDLFEHLEPGWRAAGAVFVTSALDHGDRHQFVDSAHYSADASRLIAEAIALHLR